MKSHKVLTISVVLSLSFTCFAAEASQTQDVKIDFYGKVIDGSSNPVNGAIVYAHVMCSDEKTGKKKFTVKTDSL